MEWIKANLKRLQLVFRVVGTILLAGGILFIFLDGALKSATNSTAQQLVSAMDGSLSIASSMGEYANQMNSQIKKWTNDTIQKAPEGDRFALSLAFTFLRAIPKRVTLIALGLLLLIAGFLPLRKALAPRERAARPAAAASATAPRSPEARPVYRAASAPDSAAARPAYRAAPAAPPKPAENKWMRKAGDL